MPDYISVERSLCQRDPEEANRILSKAYRILSAIQRKLDGNPPFYFKWVLMSAEDYRDMLKGQRIAHCVEDKELLRWFSNTGAAVFLRADGVIITGHRDVTTGKIRYVTSRPRQESNWFLREVSESRFSVMDTEAIPGANSEKINLHYSYPRNEIVASTPLPIGYELEYSGPDSDGHHVWKVTVIVGSERIGEVADAATYGVFLPPPSAL